MSSAPTINAIPTEYAGIKFRSRLEARWAVLFDLMGGEWVYEPEGYEWDGIRYLPDFWLPKADSFFEVKPTYGVFPKQLALASATSKTVIVGVGDVASLKVVLFIPTDVKHGQIIERLYRYIRFCRKCRFMSWHEHGDTASYCRECGSSVEIDDIAKQAHNESFWNTPVIATTTNLRDRLRSGIPDGTRLVVMASDDESRISAAKQIFDAEEDT